MTIQRCSAALLFLVVFVLPGSVWALAPADGWVVWQSNRLDARHEVYRARADGSEVTRMTNTGGYIPSWAPDGRWISYHDDANTVYLMRPDGSELQTLASGWACFWMHDNSGFVVAQGGDYNLFDPETKESTLLFHTEDFPQFTGTTFQPNAITHDNRYLLLGSHLYINGYTGANGSFTSEYSALVVDLFHKDKTYFVGSGCWPFTPPAGDLVFHICANCPTHPDIYRMSLADLATRSSYAPEVAHADPDWGHEYNPRVSNDNKWIAYMASAGCHQGDDCDYDIWLHQLGTDPSARERVTQNPAFDGYPQMYVGPLWQPSSQPRLLLTPGRLTFFASVGALPAAQTIKVKNSGGGTLGAAVVTPDPSAPWLEVWPDDAGGIVFAVNGDAVTRGTLQATVTVTVDGALGSPVSVPVTLNADDSFPYPEGGAPESSDWEGGVPDGSEPLAGNPDAGSAVSGGGGGCGCALAGVPRAAAPLSVLGLALAALYLRRRRR